MALLQHLRPLAKSALMQRFDDSLTDPALHHESLRLSLHDHSELKGSAGARYLAWESSGTSGEPALFVQDALALAVADALQSARGPFALAAAASPWDWWWSGSRVALVAATGGAFASVVAFERTRALQPLWAPRSRSFSLLQPLPALLRELEAFRPDVLASYPTMAAVLAGECAAGRLRIAPRLVCTGGETLTPGLRREIHAGFGAAVHDCYGASECFVIANECRCSRLHLNADWVILEPVNAAGKPVAAGEIGERTWLTNLSNHVQPILRYEIGDRVRFVAEPCDCGSSLPLIEVQGRSDDLLALRDAQGRYVRLAPLALTTLLEDDAGVHRFVLRQQGAERLVLDLFVPPPGAAERAAAVLREHLRAQGLAAVRIEVHSHRRAPQAAASGKLQRVVADAAVARMAAAALEGAQGRSRRAR